MSNSAIFLIRRHDFDILLCSALDITLHLQNSGPPGSGKQALVSSVTSHAKNIIYIDCSELVKQARGGGGGGSSESKLVSALATQLGYFPQFQWANSFSNLVDIASVGLIGTKAGFATNLDVQIKQVSWAGPAVAKQLRSVYLREEAEKVCILHRCLT